MIFDSCSCRISFYEGLGLKMLVFAVSSQLLSQLGLPPSNAQIELLLAFRTRVGVRNDLMNSTSVTERCLTATCSSSEPSEPN